jgi:integrase
MRRGELIGLQWGDVDLERRKIAVRHSLVRGVLSSTKSYKTRYVPMTAEVQEMLAGRHSRTGHVFKSADGGPCSYATMDRNLKIIGEGIGHPRLHWHTLRHTFASQLVSSGVPLTVVKELLGHSDIKMTMRYAHFAPSLYDNAVNVLDTIGKKLIETESRQQIGNPLLLAAPAMAA